MNLYRKLMLREEANRPVRVGLIGAGKFGSMFLSQVRAVPGMHVLGIADLSLARIGQALRGTGWDPEITTTTSFQRALEERTTCITEDAEALIQAEGLDVIIDATGHPAAGIKHALLAVENGRHIVMVNVEADVLAGPYLATKFEKAGLIYSMAYGDQPALICEMIDWARTCGFSVVAAGKGTKYLPSYTRSTPDTVWEHYGLTPEEAEKGGLNPQMFNSFLDGTKSALEMAAVSNATGLLAPQDGLTFPAVGVADLPKVLKPKEDGGILERSGMVEVVSSQERNGGNVPGDLRWGVYITFECAEKTGQRSDYVRQCFKEYHVVTDQSGQYATLFRPSHLIGLELPVSVASVALRGEPTGATRAFNSDVVAVAKKALEPGEILDGEGGYTVWGRISRAEDSFVNRSLPIGLAHGLTLKRRVREDEVVTWNDVEMPDNQATRVRREMERNASA